ncbi:unnamed protein product [Symbiodinium microadriaticum]|nr:unnamed protein product [Symbiodinium microadriaticum]
MPITVLVTLLSGDQTCVSVPEDASVDVLRRKSQQQLNASLGHLITASGSLLAGSATLKQAGVTDGQTVTAVVRDAAVAATERAFALIRGDGSVVAWGDSQEGGDCRRVQEQLQNVKCIKASATAFAALRGDGSVVTWGLKSVGGETYPVHTHLHDVAEIQATAEAFAALRTDGTVATWGEAHAGGVVPAIVQSQLRDVKTIQANEDAFAAHLGDGSVVTWGKYAEFEPPPPSFLQDVLCIQGFNDGFLAMKSDSVVAWGWGSVPRTSTHTDGDFRHCAGQMSANAWATVSREGRLHVELEGRAEELHEVEHVQRCPADLFAALRKDGTVVTFGDKRLQPEPSVQNQLRNVVQIQGTTNAFAAICGDGSVVTWGHGRNGGSSKHVQHLLSNVKAIQASTGAFAAIRDDGSVVTWGHKSMGGDSSAVQAQLKNVSCIQSTRCAFAAIRADGSVVTWGHPKAGGDSQRISPQLGRSSEEDKLSRALAARVQAAKSNAKPKAGARPKAKAKPKTKAKAKHKANATAKVKARCLKKPGRR